MMGLFSDRSEKKNESINLKIDQKKFPNVHDEKKEKNI